MMRSEKMTSRARVGAVALAAMAATLLAGCGQKKDVAPADAAGSEVVAKVNGDDMTAAQLTIALQKQRGMRPDAGDAASKAVLDQLIDEQIVAQKAVAAKLDKDPKVVAQIEAARRDILARRFIESAAETASKPADDAVQKFYDSRPALFAQRKVYTLQRVDIQAPDDRRTEIDAHVQSLKTPAELTDWLKSQKLVFTTKQEQDASEQLPPVVLEKLADDEGRPVDGGAVAVRRLGAHAGLERRGAQDAGRRASGDRAVPGRPGPPRGHHEPAEDHPRRRQGGIRGPLRGAGRRERRRRDARPGSRTAGSGRQPAASAASQTTPAQK